MPVKMAPHQLEFFRELLAPFDSSQLSEVPARGGQKMLTYLDKRSLENRLDSVCGPMGWKPEYEATSRGYKCRLWILCPTWDPSAPWIWIPKEDGAGFEEMGSKNKKTGEWEPDVDNDEKSGYTNALRRAAQDAWGIGRYLYRKGIPSFLDPNATAGTPPSAFQNPTAQQAASAALKAACEEAIENAGPRTSPQAQATQQARPATGGTGNFRIPKPGKSVYPWLKDMEQIFETKLFDGMVREGEQRGCGRQFNEWGETDVNVICMSVIAFIRELPTYKGQYEHLFPEGGVPQSQPSETTATAGVNIADIRKSLLGKMQELVVKQTGKKAENADLKKVFEAVASTAKTGEGHTGEVPEGLSKMTDLVWLRNMIVIVDKQIAEPVQPVDEDEELPF